MGSDILRQKYANEDFWRAETASASTGSIQADYERRGVRNMNTIEKDVKRMEMQIEQLISIVANQNNRLNRIEDMERKKKLELYILFHLLNVSDGIDNGKKRPQCHWRL